MTAFHDKGIFLWCYWTVHNGDTKKIAQSLVDAGFESVYVHTNNGIYEASYNGHINCTDQLVADLKGAGLTIYGWGAPYGDPVREALIMYQQTRRYGLAGYVIDAEGTWDAQSNVLSNTRAICQEYKRLCMADADVGAVPLAWCWWPLYKTPSGSGTWHNVKILQEAMKYCDVGMPMAYWWNMLKPNNQEETIVKYFVEQVLKQWRDVTTKPIIMAGRAYTDQYANASRVGCLTFDQHSRALGADGITWWDMQHAIKIDACWQALKETDKFNIPSEPEEPEEPTMSYKSNAIGLVTDKAAWTNTEFGFIAGIAGESYNTPNANLKPIELKAAGEGKPFIAIWKFSAALYIAQQTPMEPWMTEAGDTQLQMFIRALTSRNVQGVVVQVTNPFDNDNKAIPANYLNHAAKIFVERACSWVQKNKPGAKFFIGTSNEFIQKYAAPDLMDNWAHKYNSWIIQETTSLDESYPVSSDKPAYISTHDGWEVWQYFGNKVNAATTLALFNGTKDQVRAFFDMDAGQDATPPSAPTNLTADVDLDTVSMAWEAATDNVGVVGYKVYRNGSEIGQTSKTAIQYDDQQSGLYTYGVSAIDKAGNESQQAVVTIVIGQIDQTDYVTVEEFEAMQAHVAAMAVEMDKIKTWAQSVRVTPLG